MELGIFRVLLSRPPAHFQEEVADREAVATHRVAERVLGSETQLQAPVGVTVGLRGGEQDGSAVGLVQQINSAIRDENRGLSIALVK